MSVFKNIEEMIKLTIFTFISKPLSLTVTFLQRIFIKTEKYFYVFSLSFNQLL